ncbi:hypothetical protein BS47DRAFT_1390730 [Hydnum rufescens UP504]|uniref:Deoxyhypusine hydroxylase n=1 Tax=Hydnum rufescens UP504 TaxID=1448309 RepID=A0A9P6B2F8_9AGAM|nr:hypothetical protein BS47DRAFT_1390730 [Hydnum rufescens UP504]
MTESTSAETAGFFSSTSPIAPIGDKTLQSLSDQLLNSSGTTPLHSRFRALFTLKSICIPPFTSPVSSSIVSTIAAGFSSDRTSALLRHELAYVLGQIGSPLAIPILEQVLCDVQGQEEMVRHEAAEALAAIGSTSSIPLLQKFATEPGRGGKDDGRVVRETCEIALAKIQWNQSDEAKKAQAEGELLDRYGVFVNYFKQFTSIDPAPPLIAHSPLVTMPPSTIDKEIPAARSHSAITDSHVCITKYRHPEAIDALCAGFDDDSALFKHEIAFILGQLSHPHSIPALVEVLKRPNESAMVRHEAAEALGGIPSPSVADDDGLEAKGSGSAVFKLLREWAAKDDAPQVVRDSCVVAVDMWEYENSSQFQYANGLEEKSETIAVS